MFEPLPYGESELVENLNNIDFNSITDEDYILTVALDYPTEHHRIHKDLPFCTEYQVSLGSKLLKLMTTFYPQRKYILHYQYFEEVLAKGVKLIKIYKILKFKQSSSLQSYIN